MPSTFNNKTSTQSLSIVSNAIISETLGTNLQDYLLEIHTSYYHQKNLAIKMMGHLKFIEACLISSDMSTWI